MAQHDHPELAKVLYCAACHVVIYYLLAFFEEGTDMSVATLVRAIEEVQLRADRPELQPGDSVRVHLKVVEGTRERIQVFEGLVIRLRADGLRRAFTVRRIASHNVGVERSFLLHSPQIDKIEIVRHNVVRRKNLYYMRKLRGKAARLKERREV
jgi:large subunit ribosomal protein L19